MSAKSLFVITLVVGLLGAAAQPVFAQTAASAKPQPVAKLDATASEIGFTTRQLGVPVEGRFTRFDARIALDPKQPQTGTVSFSIDTDSARFGTAELDAEVPKPVWLGVQQHPQASFQSSAIKATAPGRFEVSGKLQIKGRTQDVVVPVVLTQSGTAPDLKSTASGSFAIKRLAFKVGEGEWADTSLLADEVQVRFKFVLAGLPAL